MPYISEESVTMKIYGILNRIKLSSEFQEFLTFTSILTFVQLRILRKFCRVILESNVSERHS